MRPLALILLLVLFVRADEWKKRHKPHRFVSAGGGRSVVATRTANRRGLLFEIFEGDKLVGSGQYAPMPNDIGVPEREAGLVLCDVYRKRGAGAALVWVEPDGKERWAVEFRDLFTSDETARFEKGTWGFDWLHTWWVADDAIVLVTRTKLVIAVSTPTGKVERIVDPTPYVPAGPKRYLEAAAFLETRDAVGLARALLDDETRPVANRLRAAIVLKVLEGESVALVLWNDAIAKGQTEADQAYALHAAAMHKDEGAAEWLGKAALRKDLYRPALEALGSLGPFGMRTLVGLLSHERMGPKARAFAAKQVQYMPADRLLDAILRDLKDARGDPATAGPLLAAAVAQPVPDLAERLKNHEKTLINVLNRDSGPTGWIADYFAQYPTSEAIKPLLKQLRRHRTDDKRDRIIRALKTCTGQDFGDDVDAWLKNVVDR